MMGCADDSGESRAMLYPTRLVNTMKIPITHVARRAWSVLVAGSLCTDEKNNRVPEGGGLFWFSYSGTCWKARLPYPIRVKYLCIFSLIKPIFWNIFYTFHKQWVFFNQEWEREISVDVTRCFLHFKYKYLFKMCVYNFVHLYICKVISYSLIVIPTVWWVFYIHSIQHSPFLQDIHLQMSCTCVRKHHNTLVTTVQKCCLFCFSGYTHLCTCVHY